MHCVCLRAKGIGAGEMRIVVFWRSCGSGNVAGCWGMLAVLGSTEPAGCHHPAKGALVGVLRQPPGQHSSAWGAWEFSWTACSSRASRQELPVMVITRNSMVAVSFLLPKRGKISIPPEHEKFPHFSGGMLTF